jgi:hypothetical protein
VSHRIHNPKVGGSIPPPLPNCTFKLFAKLKNKAGVPPKEPPAVRYVRKDRQKHVAMLRIG